MESYLSETNEMHYHKCYIKIHPVPLGARESAALPYLIPPSNVASSSSAAAAPLALPALSSSLASCMSR